MITSFDPKPRRRLSSTLRLLSRAVLALGIVCSGAQAHEDHELPTEIDADRTPSTVTGGDVFIQNGTLLTVTHGTIENGSILVRDGKIVAIGTDLLAPDDVEVIDATDRYVMPGIVDCHSHIAIDGGVNEGTLSVTAEVRIGDVVNNRSLSIYRALAGGKTVANLLHGSANTIGGQNAVVKMKYRKPVSEMFFGAPRGIKFALGENVKQSNFTQNRGKRFPNSRLGVEATLRRSFQEALAYRRDWEDYATRKASGKTVPPPRRDLRLETLSGVLSGEVLVHCHCYRADEILMLLRIAEDFGFRIGTLQHVLEGFKVAPEIAAHGAGPSTFSDWWAYKIEAYDATPYNTALMTEAGCRVSINSDSSELDRHLYLEAAKGMRYGGISETEALKTITLHPAWQLGIDDRVGSLEVGKDADLALFNGHPFSIYSYPVMTLIEGEVYFEREAASGAGLGFEPTAQVAHAPEPVESSSGVYAVRGARLVPITSPPIPQGTLVIRDGKIAALGAAGSVEIPTDATVIDGRGLEVYPGFIDCGTSLALTEIGSVAGTQDSREIGDLQPDLKAIVAVHADSAHIPVARTNGTTTAITAPAGGLISGQAALVHLSGWTQEQMSIVDEAGLAVNFPRSRSGRGGGRRRSSRSPASSAKDRLAKLEEAIDEARSYQDLQKKRLDKGIPGPAFDPRAEALLPYVNRQRPVLLRVDRKKDILSALEFAKKVEIEPILVGCTEGWKVANQLAEAQVKVIVGPVLTVPRQRHDPYDAAYFNAAKLHEAGVRFAFQSADSANARNLPFHAGTAVAFGLPRDVALEALTIQAARFFGVEDEIGSLEPGKWADLIVTAGDPLETTSQVRHAFIKGRPIDLSSKHTELYDKYRRRLKEANPKVSTADLGLEPSGEDRSPEATVKTRESSPTSSKAESTENPQKKP